MPHNISYLQNDENSSNFTRINGVNFSHRELDILACMMNGRTSRKSISSTLSISPGTVATHMRNIMQKVRCSSWEYVREFIEEAGCTEVLKARFQDSLIHEKFQSILSKLATEVTVEGNYTCTVIIEAPLAVEHRLKIEDSLKQSGIIVQFLSQLPQPNQQHSSVVYLTQRSGANTINISDFPLIELLILKIIEAVIPKSNITHLIEEFRSFQGKLSLNAPNDTMDSHPQTLSIPKLPFSRALFIHKKLIGLIGAACICIGGFAFTNLYDSNANIIRSDMAVPPSQMCLERTALVTAIKAKLYSGHDISKVALVGMGGVGKTVLARMVGQQHRHHIVWEVNAENSVTLTRSFNELADALAESSEDKAALSSIRNNLKGDAKEKGVLTFVKDYLKDKPKWLLIFDNAGSLADISAYLPQDKSIWGDGNVIITSRNSNLSNSFYLDTDHIFHINELTQEEGLTLFSKILFGNKTVSKDKMAEAANFLRNIPLFPLDIAVTAHYMHNNHISYDEYLERVKQQNFHLVQEAMLHETHMYAQSRHDLIILSLQQVLNSNPEFVDLVLMLSLLNPHHIPRELLDNFKGKLVVDAFILQMKKYSLLSQSSVDNTVTFSIPQITQEVGLPYLTESLGLKTNPSRITVITQMLERYVNTAIDAEDSFLMKLLTPHIEQVLKSDLVTGSLQGALYCLLGCLDYYQGNDLKSQENLQKALQLLRKSLLGNSTRIAAALSCIGDAYKNLGKYEEAIQALEEATLMYSQSDSNSLRNAHALTYLGNTYRMKGMYGKAKAVLQQSLNIYKKHPHHTAGQAQASSVLSTVYRDLGDYKGAKDLLEKNLISSKENEKYPLWTVTISLCLGSTYTALGYYDKAKTLLEESFDLEKKTYSEGHVLYGWNLTHLGDVYLNLGETKLAQEYLEKAQSIFATAFTSTHIGRTVTQSRLGRLYLEIGNLEKAEAVLLEDLSLIEQLFGKDHFQLGYSLNALGLLYLKKEDFDTTESYLQKSLKAYEQVDHTDMFHPLESLGNLYTKKATFHKKQGDIASSLQFEKQARDYFIRSLDIAMARFPSDSPHIARIKQYLK